MLGRAPGGHSHCCNNNRAVVAAAQVMKQLVGAHGALRPVRRQRKTFMGQEERYDIIPLKRLCYLLCIPDF